MDIAEIEAVSDILIAPDKKKINNLQDKKLTLLPILSMFFTQDKILTSYYLCQYQ